jgi:hypothetical protein
MENLNVNQELLETYVIPYYLSLDKLTKNSFKPIKTLVKRASFDEDIKELLEFRGWRNRVVATTIVGALKMDKYLPRFFDEAKKFNDYHLGGAYAFYMVMIGNAEAKEFVRHLCETELESDYARNIQNFYKAAYEILGGDIELEDDVKETARHLKEQVDKWKNFSQHQPSK